MNLVLILNQKYIFRKCTAFYATLTKYVITKLPQKSINKDMIIYIPKKDYFHIIIFKIHTYILNLFILV